jgi:hypothetical protein
MRVDLRRFHRGEWAVAAGAVVLLVSMLVLPWYAHPQTETGWNDLIHFRWLALATLLLSAALLFFQATRRAPAVPVAFGVFVTFFGALTAAWLIYRVGIAPDGGRKVGGWIGLAGVIAITYGGMSSMRRQGLEDSDAPAAIRTVDPWSEAPT